MLIHPNEIQPETEFDFDLCVIGAGACGIAVARTFNHRNVKVALIESGGFEYSSEAHNLYSGKTTGVDEEFLDQEHKLGLPEPGINLPECSFPSTSCLKHH